MSGSEPEPQPTGFLYPFIEAEEHDADRLLEDLMASARAKIDDSAAMRARSTEAGRRTIAAAAAEMAARFGAGGRLLTFGNGGSATDAQGAAHLFLHPPAGRPVPALCLADDQAVLTALANDLGVELVFSRQLIAQARPDDVAVGFSTSGNSANVIAAFEEAARRGLVTVGLSGYDGGAMARSPAVRHSLVVPSQSVHRIQESQNTLVMALWSATQEAMAATAGAA